MSLRHLPRPRRLHLHHHLPHPHTPFHRNSSTSPSPSSTHTRINRLLARLPAFLHPYTSGLRHAPVSHITSFLILHEITAIVPLVGLATAFHYCEWFPERWVQGRWVGEGVERFGRYFGRKGWFGFTPSGTAPSSADTEPASSIPPTSKIPDSSSTSTNSAPVLQAIGTNGQGQEQVHVEEYVQQKWHASEAGTRILVEVATAYAITKVLLPIRVMVSVWAAPWFAMAVLGRVGRLAGRMRGRGGVLGVGGGSGEAKMSGAAGTGATGGGVVGKGSGRGP